MESGKGRGNVRFGLETGGTTVAWQMKTAEGYSICPCRGVGELAACVGLQQRIWGYADLEVYPLRLFVNLARIGGHVLGAFTAANELVGFVAAMPAWRNGRRYLHSLSLGILPEHENRGLGRALKVAQRREALRVGVERIEWSFDPLRAKNAFFNIERLGAVCRRYYADYYGPVASRLQQGLPSDRLIAEWRVKSRRVARALAGKPPRHSIRPPAAEVAIPADFGAIARSHPDQAAAAQREVRARLLALFQKKFVVTGFASKEGAGRYLLDRNAN